MAPQMTATVRALFSWGCIQRSASGYTVSNVRRAGQRCCRADGGSGGGSGGGGAAAAPQLLQTLQ